VTRGFRRTRRGIRVRLDDHERALLAHLLVVVHDLLDDGTAADDTDPLAAMLGIGTAVDAPADPALARLLPDAHRDDPEAAAEFRRYTEVGLRERKRAGIELARRTLGREGALVLDEEEARAWVVALTDVRLVLASRMGLEVDEDHERLQALAVAEMEAEADPEVPSERSVAVELAVYDVLTWLQETLVSALMEPLPSGD
jgi:hypothetical protein